MAERPPHEVVLGARILAGFAGVGALARTACVSRSQVWAAVNGNALYPGTVARLEAVDIVDLSTRVSQVAAVGVRLRTGALLRQGWTVRGIADRTGTDAAALSRVLRFGHQKRVRSAVWRSVQEHTDALLRSGPGLAHIVPDLPFLTMPQLEEDLLDLVEPWRSAEIDRRARELLCDPEFRPRAAAKRGERSEVVRRAVRMYDVERAAARRRARQEVGRGG